MAAEGDHKEGLPQKRCTGSKNALMERQKSDEELNFGINIGLNMLAGYPGDIYQTATAQSLPTEREH